MPRPWESRSRWPEPSSSSPKSHSAPPPMQSRSPTRAEQRAGSSMSASSMTRADLSLESNPRRCVTSSTASVVAHFPSLVQEAPNSGVFLFVGPTTFGARPLTQRVMSTLDTAIKSLLGLSIATAATLIGCHDLLAWIGNQPSSAWPYEPWPWPRATP